MLFKLGMQQGGVACRQQEDCCVIFQVPDSGKAIAQILQCGKAGNYFSIGGWYKVLVALIVVQVLIVIYIEKANTDMGLADGGVLQD